MGNQFFLLFLVDQQQLCAHHQKNLLYLCDTGIFHCVRVAVWSADQTATHTE